MAVARGELQRRRTPIGNTMAPCVIIGERAAELINDAHIA
jgi:hypothetical protein